MREAYARADDISMHLQSLEEQEKEQSSQENTIRKQMDQLFL